MKPYKIVKHTIGYYTYFDIIRKKFYGIIYSKSEWNDYLVLDGKHLNHRLNFEIKKTEYSKRIINKDIVLMLTYLV